MVSVHCRSGSMRGMTMATENLPDDIAALKQIIAGLSGDAAVAQAEIAKLKFQLARYRRA